MKKTVLLLFLFLLFKDVAGAFPSIEELKKSYRKSDAVLLDRHGEVIHELRVDPVGRRLEWAALKDISPALIHAVLQSEDRRFFEHGGVDWKATVKAALGNMFAGGQRGASTISMQLASILDKGLRPRSKKRSIGQKWDQMQAGRELERVWSKDAILEAYLNLVSFRGELQGITAASRGLFDKDVSGLNDHEALILASLIRGPNSPTELVAKRACLLAGSMNMVIACNDLNALAGKSLVGPFEIRKQSSIAPFIAKRFLKREVRSFRSSLDAGLQRFASDVLRYHLRVAGSRNVHDGAVLVADNKTGEVLAYVANTGSISSAQYVDGITARRQAGSALKPFLYGLAFERRLLSPSSIIVDSPLDIPTAFGIYRPENYDNEFKGPVAVRYALASSLNVPAVRTLSLVGIGSFVRRLRELGFGQLEDEEYYGFSIALGAADITLHELVNAYRTIANRGEWSKLIFSAHDSAGRKRRVFSEEAALLVSAILSDREARNLTFGLENPLSTKFWTAVKTGTSKDMRDNWCIGYSGRYTVGVWVGNFNGEPMWNVSGVTGAAPVWHEIMEYLHRKEWSNPPRDIERVMAETLNNLHPGGLKDYSHDGQDEHLRAESHQQSGYLSVPRIIYPAEGMIIAIDPDIPEDQQRVFFEASGAGSQISWVLNGADLGPASEVKSWKPEAGTFRISLVTKDQKVVDSIQISVKGN